LLTISYDDSSNLQQNAIFYGNKLFTLAFTFSLGKYCSSVYFCHMFVGLDALVYKLA